MSSGQLAVSSGAVSSGCRENEKGVSNNDQVVASKELVFVGRVHCRSDGDWLGGLQRSQQVNNKRCIR